MCPKIRTVAGRLAFAAVCLLCVCLASCGRQEAARQPGTASGAVDTGIMSSEALAAASGGFTQTQKRTQASEAERSAPAINALPATSTRRAPAETAPAPESSATGRIPAATAEAPVKHTAPLLRTQAPTVRQPETTAQTTTVPAHPTAAQATGGNQFLTDYETQAVALVNAAREREGLAPLRVTTQLRDTAHLRVVELTQYYSHTRPDGTRCFTAFPEGGLYGENAARGQQSPAEAMESWLASQAHRANILNPDFTQIGVGCVREGDTLYWAQCFVG